MSDIQETGVNLEVQGTRPTSPTTSTSHLQEVTVFESAKTTEPPRIEATIGKGFVEAFVHLARKLKTLEEEIVTSKVTLPPIVDSSDSYDSSVHSSFCREDSPSYSEDTEDSSEDAEEPGHDDSHLVKGESPLKYGEIPFGDLVEPEKYSNYYFEVKKSPLGGFGAFAARDLKRGQIILAERPVVESAFYDLKEQLEKLPPELQTAIGRMHGHRRSRDENMFKAIFMTNSFSVQGGSCLYLIAARFNHSCGSLRTVNHRIIKDNIIEFTMDADVAAGTELTISYGPFSPQSLYSMWGFRCGCGWCRPMTDEEVAKLDGAHDEMW